MDGGFRSHGISSKKAGSVKGLMDRLYPSGWDLAVSLEKEVDALVEDLDSLDVSCVVVPDRVSSVESWACGLPADGLFVGSSLGKEDSELSILVKSLESLARGNT